MKNVFTIKPTTKKNSNLLINTKKAVELRIDKKKRACLHFGSLKVYATVITDDGIADDVIEISQKLMDELHLPEYPIYEVSAKDNDIVIGPYIGLLLSREAKKLTQSRLNRALIYVREYHKLHGAIVVFALDKVDTSSRLIEGYCYNPKENRMQPGIFPYPSAIYRMVGLSDKWKNHFLSVIGNNFFNNPYFNKWEMYQWVSKDSEIGPHIPHSILYESHEDVFNMLNKFGKIYIKPVSGLGGRGIVQARLDSGSYVFKVREKGANHVDRFITLSDAAEFVKKRFLGGRYIIQQAVDLLDVNGGIIDFRCIVQKNQSGKWVCKAIIGRQGAKNSVVSNITSGGRAFKLEPMGRDLFFDNLYSLKAKIEAFALKVCNKLDEFGLNCGTLGVDVGVGKDERLWLFEINNRDPDPSIALNVNDVRLYYNIKAGPLFYAKFLAGFKEEQE